MDRFIEIKKALLRYAENSEDLLAVIAIGSSVRSYDAADAYSDLDMILVCRNPADWLYGDLPENWEISESPLWSRHLPGEWSGEYCIVVLLI